MRSMSRRTALAVGGTLAAGLIPRSPHAAVLAVLPAKLVLTEPPTVPPDAAFTDSEGVEHRIAAFLGRGMVINFWATWCAPCVAEMPALAALSQSLGPHDIAVLPLSSDRGGAAVVEPWLRGKGLTSLPVLLGTAGGLGLLVGPAGLWWLHARRHAAHGDAAQRPMDRAFIALLFLTSLTGLGLLLWRETAAMALLLAVHLGVVMALFATMPYGKFVHFVYRYAALVRNRIEMDRAEVKSA